MTPGRVEVLPLAGCGLRETGDLAVEWQAALLTLEREWSMRVFRVVERVLTTLWERVARPVLAALPDEPRVWWIPTGPLALLPVHAALGDDGSVLDRSVSSYTPTLRDLAEARRRAAVEREVNALVVAVPQGPVPLPGAAREAREVGRRLGGRSLLDATVAEVVGALPAASHAHFACHGAQDVLDPASARLILHDGPLWLRDLAELRLPAARLAYLSACRTAVGALRLTDEAVHLAATMQLIGFPEVVATGWAVDDSLAAEIAAGVYDRLAAGGAVALRETILATRAAHPDDVLLWSAYLHLGP